MTLTEAPYRSISEVSEEIGVPQHVLRFWEGKFSFIRPMKRAGGRRFYRPQDVGLLRGIKTLVQDRGLTLKGVLALHRGQGVAAILAAGNPDAKHDALEGLPFFAAEEGSEPLTDQDTLDLFSHPTGEPITRAQGLSDEIRTELSEVLRDVRLARQQLTIAKLHTKS